jgi:uncharacterized membrane protein
MKTSYWIIIGVIALSFAIGIYLYPDLPPRMAAHWNSQGLVDGYMPKFWALFLLPLISITVFLLLIFLPRLDPLKHNIEKFRKQYETFIVFLVIFLFYLHLLTLLFNLGITFNMVQAMAPGFAILFYCAGMLMENAKQNWFIGIRTPWTLSSEEVWNKTHKLGSKLFKAAGIIMLFGIILPKYAIWLMLVPIISVTLYLFIYSYMEYKKIRKK